MEENMWKKIVLSLLIIISGIAGFFVAKAQVTFNNTLNHVNRDYDTALKNVDLSGIKVNSDDDIVNILVVGNDYRKEKGYDASGLTDTMIIATMDMKHGMLKLTTLMRDMVVDIPGHDPNKLNSPNSFGGIELLYKTIAQNFNIELDGYVEVGFEAFEKIVNSVGGIEVELTKRGYKVHIQENDKGKVYGYSVKRGNSNYKSSVLGIGRNLTPSKIEATWAKLHPQERTFEQIKPIPQQTRTTNADSVIQPKMAPQPAIRHYDIATDEYHSYHVEIPEVADNIIRQECSLEEAHPLAKIEEIQHTALLLFAGYLDAATSIAVSSGGGGSDTGDWGRDKDEDELEWARRCARMANTMCKRRKGLHR